MYHLPHWVRQKNLLQDRKNMMKKIALTAALALTALVLAFPAKAEPNPLNEFLEDLSASGFNITKSNESDILIVGLGICVDMLSGTSQSEEIEEVVNYGGLTEQVAAELVEAAVGNLCPTASAKYKT